MFLDPPDYDEIESTRAEYRREEFAELREEHNHGSVIGSDGKRRQLECADCHDERECEDYDCFWCVAP